MPSSAKQLHTIRTILEPRTTKICAKSPIETTEDFIKFQQPWPINKEKDDKDKPSPDKKQKRGAEEGWKDALKKVSQDNTTFSTDKYINVSVIGRKKLSHDTRVYTFKHNLDSVRSFNLGIGQHPLCGFMMQDGIVERPYAITRPTGDDHDDGTIDILVKTAFPSEKDPGGTVSNIMDMLDEDRGDEMLMRGPEGPISYLGNGRFTINGQEHANINKVNFISGGTGMTPVFATIRAILETDEEKNVEIHFLDANVNQEEILQRRPFDEMAHRHPRFKITHVLEKPEDEWTGETGLVDEDKMKRHLHPADDGTITLICGPPPMVDAMKDGLKKMGFEEDKNFFHY